jgi:nucleoside-diphosphate-sugar epimerase
MVGDPRTPAALSMIAKCSPTERRQAAITALAHFMGTLRLAQLMSAAVTVPGLLQLSSTSVVPSRHTCTADTWLSWLPASNRKLTCPRQPSKPAVCQYYRQK